MNNDFIFHKALNDALDGRTNRWLCVKTGIGESEISRIVSGRLIPTENQKQKIENVFPSLKQQKDERID